MLPTKSALAYPLFLEYSDNEYTDRISLFDPASGWKAFPGAITFVACSLMPFALPTAQADVQENLQIWEHLTVQGNFGFINPDNPDLKRWR